MKSIRITLDIFKSVPKHQCYFSQCSGLQNESMSNSLTNPPHTPVMSNEVLSCLQPKSGDVFIDMTFGAGGHSKKLLETVPDIKIFALDRDPLAFTYAEELSKKFPENVTPLLGRFSDLHQLLKSEKVNLSSVDGILFDLGVSSMQFDIAERGFSVSKDGPLDMRMDGYRNSDQPTAADVLAQLKEEDLAKIFKVYGEEKQAKKIARAIIEARYSLKGMKTTSELRDVVAAALESDHRLDKLQRHSHAATKIFQALRIFVNNEINELNYGIILAYKYLKIGGRIVTIAFHSLEDRIIKRHITGNVIDNAINPLPLKYTNCSLCHDLEEIQHLMDSNWKSIYKHVVLPTEDEVLSNPRSRSAKLRAAIKVK